MRSKDLVAYGKNRIRNNQNMLGLFCGSTGSGKSYSAMCYAEALDDKFDISRVVFTIKDFMKLLNTVKLRKGSVILFDECGVGIPARDWYTISNKFFGYIMQTFRNKNLIVLFTTPSLSYIDKQLRYLFHLYFESIRIDRKAKRCIMKPMLVQYSPRYGKIYFKYPVRVHKGRVQSIQRIRFALPSKKLIKDYEAKKWAYTKDLNLGVQAGLEKMDLKKEKKKPFNPQEFADKVKALNWDRVTIDKIRVHFNLTRGKASMVRVLL